MDRGTLLARIDQFKADTGMSDTAIGLGALKDGKFVTELRAGRRCWPETAEKVLSYLASVETEREAA